MSINFIPDLINELTEIREEEFKHVGYEYVPPIIKKTIPKENKMELQNLKYKLTRISNKKKKFDKNGNEIENKEAPYEVDILNDNIFNTIKDETVFKEWRYILEKDKISKIKEYYEKNKEELYLDENHLESLIKLIKTNKINYKKYITYNKFNGTIISLPILQINDKDKVTIIKIIKKVTKKKKGIFKKKKVFLKK